MHPDLIALANLIVFVAVREVYADARPSHHRLDGVARLA